MIEVTQGHLMALELAMNILAGHTVQEDAANDLRDSLKHWMKRGTENVMRADAAERKLSEATNELDVLREYRNANIAFINSHGDESTVEQSSLAEYRLDAAEKACWEFYRERSAGCAPCGGWGSIAAEPGDSATTCEHCEGGGKAAAKGGDGEDA